MTEQDRNDSPDSEEQGAAIIGMAGRFPGARDLDEFWRNLCQGVESVTFFSRRELQAAGVDAALLDNPSYVPARCVLEGVELFDAGFFGFTPREAEILDPQHRLFLETAWEALEKAGYDPSQYPGPIGVFASTGTNSYLIYHLLGHREILQAVGSYQVMLGNDNDFLATRASYKLNLRGPSFTVQTACSSSLTALHLAVQSLLDGECDIALSGGVRIALPQQAGYLYEQGGVLSPDGHCRAFDASAGGSIDGNGAGVVILKRLAEAQQDGDSILAVVRGTAINNDGAQKVGYTAPSIDGQAEVISIAQAVARAEPESIGYIEAHGTGTVLGDPIELAALKKAFGSAVHNGYCAIGSLKTNIGHLDAAAGAASLIKTVLALQHRRLPPSLNFEKPNPDFDFENSPFYVNDRLRDWPRGKTPRRAGVSSFGIGGTNAHAVLEEAPPQRESGQGRPWQLLLLSARSATALEKAGQNFLKHFQENPQVDLADAAYTLQVGRKAFDHRRMLVCRDRQDAARCLESLDPVRVMTRVQQKANRPVAFAFPGQGAQYPQMCRRLYECEPLFRQVVDDCSEALALRLGLDLRQILYPDDEKEGNGERLRQTALAQPALFVVEYALARLWMDWGIQPAGMIGHSIGEYAAACLAGALTLEDALALVAQRGKLMQQLPGGAMLAVELGEDDLMPLLKPGVSLAALNAPRLSAASGPFKAIDALAASLEERGIGHRRLHTSHAFHSAMMDPILDDFAEALRSVELKEPKLRWVSNLSGDWIRPEQAMDPDYWVQQLRRPVRFSQGLERLLEDPQTIVLETGPGNTLGSLARRRPKGGSRTLVLASSRHPRTQACDEKFLLTTLGRLWLEGAKLDWQGFHSGFRRKRLPLPTYPFERRRYWLEARPDARPATVWRGRPGKIKDLSEWFSVPCWQQSPPLLQPRNGQGPRDERWMVFVDAGEAGAQVASRLEGMGVETIAVAAGNGFNQLDEGRFEIEAGSPEDYRRLISLLYQDGRPLHGISHFWGLTPPGVSIRLEEAEGACFYSLLFLAQALGEVAYHAPLRIVLFSNGAQRVSPADSLQPEKALLWGPCLVIPLEYPGISCRHIDVTLPGRGGPEEDRVYASWTLETLCSSEETSVAYRGTDRWVRQFGPLPLPKALQPPPLLRPRGVYLITGGWGGLGFETARELARQAQARLVLAGRSQEADEQRSRQMRELQELGAEVLSFPADVADPQQVESLLREVKNRFGTLHGVIHAAGVAGGGAMQLKTRSMAESVLAPKVRGALNLSSALQDAPLDFFVLFSSLASVLGGPGQVDYCAANAFLNAFAQDQASRQGGLTVSLSWDSWQKVGMAARAAQAQTQPEADDDLEAKSQPIGHPLLERGFAEDGRRRTFTTRLTPSRHWVLSEHRLGGQPVVPGTAYLEMARAAYESLADQAALEMRDVLFLGPLQVRDDESKEVRTVIEKEGQSFRFTVKSRLEGPEPGGRQWQEHVTGTIFPLTEQPSPGRSLDEIIRDCSLRREKMDEEYREGLRSAGLGPHWEVLQKVYVGQDQVLGVLSLDEDFAAEFEDFKLHPSLLDAATGFAEHYMELDDSYYLPLSYQRLRLYSPLEPVLYSHARFPSGGPGKETVSYDLELRNARQEVLAQIEGFTVKRVPNVGEAVRAYAERENAPAAPPAASQQPQSGSAGILPEEGVEVFCRLISQWTPPQVLVSTQGLTAALEETRSLARLLQEDQEGGAQAAAGHPRPELATPYVAPRNPSEERIAAIWQAVLGIEQVGIHDDFFELGGHSLLATQVASRVREALQADVAVGALFEASTVAEFAALLGEGAPVEQTEQIPRAPSGSEMPLSYAQRRLWFLEQFSPGNPVYNISQAVRLRGNLNVGALQAGLSEIVRRHEILRVSIRRSGGQPVQVAGPTVLLALPLIDLSALPRQLGELQIGKLAAGAACHAFDLASGPLAATRLLRSGPDEHVFLLTLHQIAGDGWSVGIFVQELAAFYEAAARTRYAPLPEPPLQYPDFAAWQLRRLGEEEAVKAQIDYWMKKLGGPLPALDLPLDRPRPAVQTFRGAARFFRLPRGLTRRLKALSGTAKASLFMVLLAGFKVLLQRFSGQTDLIVGSPAAGRDRSELEGLIGNFLNTLALRTDLSGDPSFAGLLERVRETALEAYSRQEVPFERIVEGLQPDRDTSRTPVFQTLFSMQDFPVGRAQVAGLRMESLPVRDAPAQTDITIFAAEADEEIRIELLYNRSLFDETTIIRLQQSLLRVFEQAADDPLRQISRLDLLSAPERHQLSVEWNDTSSSYPRQSCIHELFEAQAAARPDAVALALEAAQLSYAELGRRAGHAACFLQKRGAGPDSLVGSFVERSLEMVIGLLGILKAGAAYLPLDPAYPPERLGSMIEDASVETVLSLQHLLGRLPEKAPPAVCLDSDWDVICAAPASRAAATAPENLAYLMYTSGSTGRPKGVAVPHRGVVRLAMSGGYLLRGPKQVFLQTATISFDASTFQIWGCLLNGGRLALFPPRTPDLGELERVIRAQGATYLGLPAALFRLMAEHSLPVLLSLQQVLAGGDVLSAPHARRALEAGLGRLVNGYGPTENTTYTCCHLMQSPEQRSPVPIGHAIANTTVHVLDRRMNPVPEGVGGELYTGGDGLARGYWRRPGLTARRFVPNPFACGERLYRSGDLVRVRRGGLIEFLGRLDQQVKIRGFRVEPGEVEAVLCRHPQVKEAAVAVAGEEAGQKRLTAYAVGRQKAVSEADLRAFLQQHLPDFMIPSAFVALEALPLTPNGKLDRRALPPAEEALSTPKAARIPPRDHLELQLVQIWQEVLGVQPIGVSDDFFELGGHSLLAMELLARIEEVLGRQVPLVSLFHRPTVEHLAESLRDRQAAPESRLLALQPSGSRTPFFCVHPAGGSVLGYLDLVRCMGTEQPFYGLRAAPAGGRASAVRVGELASLYIAEVRAVQVQGPYLLGGHSFGGVVAFEMARQLQAQGHEVGLLALLDSRLPEPDRESEELGAADLLGGFALQLGLPPESLDEFQAADGDAQGQLGALLGQAKQAGLVPPGLDAGRIGHLFRGFCSHVQAGRSYRPRPAPVGAVLFRAAEPLPSDAREAASERAWGRWATKGVRLLEVPGNHFSMLREPHVQQLAAQLKSVLSGQIGAGQ